MNAIAQIQNLLGLPADGTWSPTDQASLIKADSSLKRDIQRMLGVVVDGFWGMQSQTALNDLRASLGDDWIICKASSFADPKDVAAFKRCKATGKSDVACFAVGDNGVGEFGDITAQNETLFVAVHEALMISRWGSVHAAAHREVQLMINGKLSSPRVGDRISAPGRLDLNPAVLKFYGLKPPLLVDAKWRWA